MTYLNSHSNHTKLGGNIVPSVRAWTTKLEFSRYIAQLQKRCQSLSRSGQFLDGEFALSASRACRAADESFHRADLADRSTCTLICSSLSVFKHLFRCTNELVSAADETRAIGLESVAAPPRPRLGLAAADELFFFEAFRLPFSRLPLNLCVVRNFRA